MGGCSLTVVQCTFVGSFCSSPFRDSKAFDTPPLFFFFCPTDGNPSDGGTSSFSSPPPPVVEHHHHGGTAISNDLAAAAILAQILVATHFTTAAFIPSNPVPHTPKPHAVLFCYLKTLLCEMSSPSLSSVSGRLRGTRYLPEFGRKLVVMATTTTAPSSVPGSLETLEETVEIAATLENGSLPSGRRNLEAIFFDLDDTPVLAHAADTVAHNAVQVCMYACMLQYSEAPRAVDCISKILLSSC
jgi:hypothetical protein